RAYFGPQTFVWSLGPTRQGKSRWDAKDTSMLARLRCKRSSLRITALRPLHHQSVVDGVFIVSDAQECDAKREALTKSPAFVAAVPRYRDSLVLLFK
ncbi:unnamed protein product, partial [Mycena citricolor]